jgi:lipoprotein-anchoring transpeptidase ErfK/SrfK
VKLNPLDPSLQNLYDACANQRRTKKVTHSKNLWRSLVVAGALSFSSISAWALKVDISVSKVSQKMTVSLDGVKTYVWLVSTGGGQYDTPSGNYKIFRMEKEHFSKEWDDAPMPYSMFFTGEGHAIHGSYHIARLGTKASHGCVRLAPENAAILFGLVQKAGYKNSTVSIRGGFFDSNPDLTVGNSPRKPFRWFWEKPRAQYADDQLIKPMLKKKKSKKAVIIGGQQG